MTLEHGILLFFIGMTLTIVGLFLAYYYGSKSKERKEYPPALRDYYGKKYINGEDDEV
jgi:hypothetical protein|tara:strand:- start:5 stop:178 length:174 start_codon:yes stop_codon:yes gene_type:complete